jgi:hypothetical protein
MATVEIIVVNQERQAITESSTLVSSASQQFLFVLLTLFHNFWLEVWFWNLEVTCNSISPMVPFHNAPLYFYTHI